MSKTIEYDPTDPSSIAALSDEDLMYLHVRGQLTDAQFAEAREVEVEQVQEAFKGLSEPTPIDLVPNTGDANTAGESIEQLEARLAQMKKDQAMGEPDEEDDEEAYASEPYETESNDNLRAEIHRRNELHADDAEFTKLSLDGKKDALIVTLRAYDETYGDEDEDSGEGS